MLAKISSATTVGLHTIPITVEVDISAKTLPSFTIVGLPSKSVEEAKERVRAAIKNTGAEFPGHRITVNLAPADIQKEGPSFDLPIAVGILAASGQLRLPSHDFIFYGELSLDGTLRHTNGILPLVLFGKEKHTRGLFIPGVDTGEAAIVKNIPVYPVTSLLELMRHFLSVKPISPCPHIPFSKIAKERMVDFDLKEVKGQEQAKRVLEIAAAGGHNLIMKGSPGAGKTMLARAIPGILPDLTEEEALEVTKIYSISGCIPAGESIIKVRPFRAPHHTTSRNGLIGGGSRPMPGEISLAHRGVLFLDEFTEFPRHVLEALRQPMEDGLVTISRASTTVAFPAKFMLLAAFNPCPCGYFGHPEKACRCLPYHIQKYQKRLSGPILDRIDLHIELPPVKVEKLTVDEQLESSKEVKKRVQKARDIQIARYKNTGIISNSDLTVRELKKQIPLSDEALSLLKRAVISMRLSARTYYKVIKVARTIADLEQTEDITVNHIAEAIQYRPKDQIH